MSSKTLFRCSWLAVIFSLAIVLVLAVGATAWGQPGQGQCCYTAPGQFRFPTSGHLEAQIGGQPVSFDLLGPTMVVTKSPNPPIPTEMVALQLNGMNPMVGGVDLHLTPGTSSTGSASPPSSFFDVFVEISLDRAPWLGGQPDIIYSGLPGNAYVPVHVTSSSLNCIPPQPGAAWASGPISIPLTSRTLNQPIGTLTLVVHTVLAPNHYKTWRIDDGSPLQIRTIVAKDQFGLSNLVLDSAVYLSNPVQKCVSGTCFNVADTTDHFTWYRANGQPLLLQVDYQNQFGSGTVLIDSVKYFLTPTQKFPHNAPKLLDHYKAYRIKNPLPFTAQVQLTDQFDLTDPRGPENINLLTPRYFLTPAQKNTEPVYDTLTHYIAYEINPKRLITMNRDIQDQFGVHPIRIDSSVFLLVPTCKLRFQPPTTGCCMPNGQCVPGLDSATCLAQGGMPVAACLGDANGNGIDDACEHPQEEICCYTTPGGASICGPVPVGQCQQLGGKVVAACLGDANGNGIDDACEQPTGPNHFKTWRVLQQDTVVFRSVFVRDQFLKFMKDSTVRLDSINYLSNPTRKIVFNAVGADTFNVIDTTDHLSWYRAFGNNLLKGLYVIFRNQFQTDTIRIDQVRYFLLPTQKFPHPPPDRLDHYKAYRIRGPKTLRRPVELQDQFDLQNPVPGNVERIDSLVERYFLTPARKQIPGQQPEPTYDTVTHYVAYQIYPSRHMPQIRDIQDQFGVHIVQVDSSEMLLVPTQKLFVSRKLKGDLNGSLDLSAADVVLQLNCTFLGTGDCDLSFSDENCDGTLSAADVVLELNAVFLDADFPC